MKQARPGHEYDPATHQWREAKPAQPAPAKPAPQPAKD